MVLVGQQIVMVLGLAVGVYSEPVRRADVIERNRARRAQRMANTQEHSEVANMNPATVRSDCLAGPSSPTPTNHHAVIAPLSDSSFSSLQSKGSEFSEELDEKVIIPRRPRTKMITVGVVYPLYGKRRDACKDDHEQWPEVNVDEDEEKPDDDEDYNLTPRSRIRTRYGRPGIKALSSLRDTAREGVEDALITSFGSTSRSKLNLQSKSSGSRLGRPRVRFQNSNEIGQIRREIFLKAFQERGFHLEMDPQILAEKIRMMQVDGLSRNSVGIQASRYIEQEADEEYFLVYDAHRKRIHAKVADVVRTKRYPNKRSDKDRVRAMVLEQVLKEFQEEREGKVIATSGGDGRPRDAIIESAGALLQEQLDEMNLRLDQCTGEQLADLVMLICKDHGAPATFRRHIGWYLKDHQDVTLTTYNRFRRVARTHSSRINRQRSRLKREGGSSPSSEPHA